MERLEHFGGVCEHCGYTAIFHRNPDAENEMKTVLIETKHLSDWGNLLTTTSDPEQFRFIVIDGALLIGEVRSHALLPVIHEAIPFQKRDWLGGIARTPFAEKLVQQWKQRVTAAGIADTYGQVVGWNSIGFGIETPLQMRQELREHIKATIHLT
jgi:hypothetical protein